MARVLTNTTALALATQEARGTLGADPEWKTLEPNDIGRFGTEITAVERNPISNIRQRRKGTAVDLDSGVEFEADLTCDLIDDVIEGFLFANAVNADLTFRAANAGATGWTIPAATAAQGAKIQFTSGGPITLVYSRGYAAAANNGLFELTADTASTGTLLARTGLTTETAPANAEVSVCGIRCEAGDLAVSVSSGIATLTSGNNAAVNDVDFTTLGLTVGQRIHVGGLTDTNRFAGVAAVSYGSGRIRTIAAGTLTLDKLDDTLIASDGTDDGAGGTLVPVDLLFGRFVRNVATNHASFLERYHQVELEEPNLYETEPATPVAEPDGYSYALDNLMDALSLALPLTDKATCTVGMIGTDTEDPVDGASRKTNAATPREPLLTEPFNTSADYFRLRIAGVDDTGILSDFKDLTLTIANGVSGERVQGTFGPKYLNIGNFLIDLEATALFTSRAVIAAIRALTTVSFDFGLVNDDGAVHFDVPSATIEGGAREFPRDESVRIGLTLKAFVDSFFGTSLGVSLFPIYPTD